MSDHVFVDGQFKDPNTCPKSIDGKCFKCGVEVELGYGFAGDYGLGTYTFCPDCCTIMDAMPDQDE